MSPFAVSESLEEVVSFWNRFHEDVDAAVASLREPCFNSLLVGKNASNLTGLLGEMVLGQYIEAAAHAYSSFDVRRVSSQEVVPPMGNVNPFPHGALTLSTPFCTHEFDGIVSVDGLFVILESKITSSLSAIRKDRSNRSKRRRYYEELASTLLFATDKKEVGMVYFLPCGVYAIARQDRKLQMLIRELEGEYGIRFVEHRHAQSVYTHAGVELWKRLSVDGLVASRFSYRRQQT